MPEAFELGDEAPGVLVGVQAGEVLATGLAVDLPVESMCQVETMIECLTAPIA